ncbi:BTAD domain-containing putative transcriptional regulator [Nocardia sp. NPDC048505]|uniref:BTAD domain-containing putative transcriptional regulator n=1 Tax=unclassified Nocardia TaxID=2637762 RepID=UPI0033E317F9
MRTLLIALALQPGRAVPKTTLVDWIWGEQPPADVANALQALVSRLRRLLPDGSLDVQPGGYRLTVEPDAVDAVRFERLLDQARGGGDAQQAELLAEALELWRGAPMQGVDLPDSAVVDAVITRLEGLRLAALEDRYEAELRLGRGADLVAELTEAVTRNPVRERLVAALMQALAAAGRAAEALTVYQQAREALADSLGVDPSPELSELHVALLRGDVRADETDRRTNLRAELTRFVGTYADVAAVRDLIAGHRLTTLTGPGGTGKTRLAVETARTMLADLPDGAWLVELAPLGPAGDVAQAALAALGRRDALLGASNAEPLDRFVAAIRDRETLLILDNCEHLIEAAATFAHRVLGECAGLRILATSREPLGITGEALWQVEPLALPGPGADPAQIESSPAVQLLRDRAGAVRQDLGADAASLATMARVCRALDGIPLAIELAAARLRTMTLDQLAHRLDDRFRLLTGGSRTAQPQHRTLRAVVDWSWELLSDAERAVLRRLSVFAGGASLAAAEHVCADAAVEQWEVLDLLTALTEKSLLVSTGDAEPRYRMLDTIKQYASERLTEAGEADTARRAHLAYYTGLAEAADPHLRRAEQLEWLAILEADQDNLAAAMRAALAEPDAPGAMGLAASAGWFWWLSGHKAEGMELITAAAALPGEVDDATRAMVYALVVHFMSSGPSDDAGVAEWIHRAHEFSRRSESRYPLLVFIDALERMTQGTDALLPAFEPLLTDEDPWVRALARLQVGKARIVLGHAGHEPDDYLAQALAEFTAVGERWGISFALTELAIRIATRGDFAAACAHLERSIAVVSEIGAVEDIYLMRARQAQLHWLMGDAAASAAAAADARRYADQSAWPAALAELALTEAELARWQGDVAETYRRIDAATAELGSATEHAPYLDAVVHNLRGLLAEDLDEARKQHAEAYERATATGYAPLIAQILVGIADLALRAEQPRQALALLAASTEVRGLADHAQPDTARIEQAARERLGASTSTDEALDWPALVAAVLTR